MAAVSAADDAPLIEMGGGRLDLIRLHAGEERGVDTVEFGDNKEARDISFTGLWA